MSAVVYCFPSVISWMIMLPVAGSVLPAAHDPKQTERAYQYHRMLVAAAVRGSVENAETRAGVPACQFLRLAGQPISDSRRATAPSRLLLFGRLVSFSASLLRPMSS